MAGEVSFGDVAWDDTGALIWLEKRPDRNALVVQEPGLNTPRDLNGEFSARSGIGYGGGAFAAGGYVFFVDAESGRVFRQPLSAGLPQPVTPAFGAAAAPTLSPDGRWLLYVHSDAGADSLAIVDAVELDGLGSWSPAMIFICNLAGTRLVTGLPGLPGITRRCRGMVRDFAADLKPPWCPAFGRRYDPHDRG